MEQINPINKVTLKDKMKSYTRHPGSLILLLLVLKACVVSGIMLHRTIFQLIDFFRNVIEKHPVMRNQHDSPAVSL